MKKVYIVTCGDYSDYTIENVFSTKELAEEYINRVSTYDDYRVEEYELDLELPKPELTTWTIWLSLKDKEVLFCRGGNCSYKDTIQYKRVGKNEVIIFYIETDRRDKAIKIASERFGAVIEAEKIKYPLLRIEINSPVKHYPMYNFMTGSIVVFNDDFIWRECYPDYVTIENRHKQ